MKSFKKMFNNINLTTFLLFIFFILIVLFVYLFFNNRTLEGAKGSSLRRDAAAKGSVLRSNTKIAATNYLKGLGQHIKKGLTGLATPFMAVHKGLNSVFKPTPYLIEARNAARVRAARARQSRDAAQARQSRDAAQAHQARGLKQQSNMQQINRPQRYNDGVASDYDGVASDNAYLTLPRNNYLTPQQALRQQRHESTMSQLLFNKPPLKKPSTNQRTTFKVPLTEAQRVRWKILAF